MLGAVYGGLSRAGSGLVSRRFEACLDGFQVVGLDEALGRARGSPSNR